MKRSKFNLSHQKLLTMPLGYLVPICVMEVLPGDIFRQSSSALIRFTPLLKPLLQQVVVKINHWFVPNRKLWDNGDGGEKGWEDFITGGQDGQDAQEHPYVEVGTVSEGDLWDYLGVPTGAHAGAHKINALPLRAYNAIYNERYRDADLISEETIDTGEGADTTTNDQLLKCAWAKDAFTTARPWQQKGANITIPLGDSAEVIRDETTKYPEFTSNGSDSLNFITSSGTNTVQYNTTAGSSSQLKWDNPNLWADLANATGIDIEDLRTAMGLQRFQERMAKYGSRYTEYLRSQGVILPDFRLNGPDYLGGGRQTVSFSEVLATDGANTGSMYGHGIAALRTNSYIRMFNEHGILMSIMTVTPKAVYMDALHRMWSRESKFDYFQRELQLVGEQEILNKEVQLSHSSPTDTFGYRPRYDSYRFMPSSVHGDFRSTEDDWHMAREFSGDIALNQSFIECTPTDRCYASTATDPLKVMVNNSITARRPLLRSPSPRLM